MMNPLHAIRRLFAVERAPERPLTPAEVALREWEGEIIPGTARMHPVLYGDGDQETVRWDVAATAYDLTEHLFSFDRNRDAWLVACKLNGWTEPEEITP